MRPLPSSFTPLRALLRYTQTDIIILPREPQQILLTPLARHQASTTSLDRAPAPLPPGLSRSPFPLGTLINTLNHTVYLALAEAISSALPPKPLGTLDAPIFEPLTKQLVVSLLVQVLELRDCRVGEGGVAVRRGLQSQFWRVILRSELGIAVVSYELWAVFD